ncbi:MAG: hypothetical protein ISS23_04025 [Nanoarchaeota archaeon]|nr:hypothetical protein [Nanoarchaeota archaeon]
MKDIYELGRNLTNCLVGEQHSVTVNTLDRCSCKGLIEDSLYLFIPHIGAEHYDSKAQKSKQNRIKESQKIVKQQILKYAKTNNLEIAVSKNSRCGSMECTGHYMDPFKRKADDEHVFIQKLPKDVNGTYVYFLKPENMEILKTIQSRL